MKILSLLVALGTNELIIILLGLTLLILPIVALVDLVKSDFKDSTSKIVWAIIIVFMPILGSIIYLIFSKNQKVEVSNFR